MAEGSRSRLRWTLRARLILAVFVVAAAVLGLRQWEMSAVRGLERAHREAHAAQVEARLALRRLQLYYAHGLGLRWGRRVLDRQTAPDQALAELRAARTDAEADWWFLEQIAPRFPDDLGVALAGPARERAAADAVALRLQQILEARDRSALARFVARELDPAILRLDQQFKVASDALRRGEPDLLRRMGAETQRQQTVLNLLLAAVVVGVVGVIVLLFRGLDRDIARLAAHARRLSARDFRTPLGELPAGELSELGGAFVTMQDALAQYEHELQNSERLFTLSSDLMCVAGIDGYFRQVNPAFEKTLGYTPDELRARPLVDFLHPDDVAATQAEVGKLAQGLPTTGFENRYRCKDGSYKWLNWQCQPARDGTLYAVARDVTAHKRLLQELHERKLEARAANQAKSGFLAAMSHEIRTPLIGVLGMLEVLGKSRLDDQQRRQFDIVQQSATSLLEIIGDILDYSKIEAGKVELALEPIAVRDLVSRVISNFSANAEARGLRLVQEVAPEVAPVHVGDAVRIRQVLANFVGNAVKFTERGSVTLRVGVVEEHPGAQRLAFSVADSGIGIAPEHLPRLFQPFAQSDASTTRRFGGTGLGLVICRRLAELMGGAVRAESEPGRGTTMHLDLLLTVSTNAAVTAAAGDEAPVRTRRKPSRAEAEQEGSLLLLAEDHPINRRVLTDQLDLAGFLVDTADNGTAALEKFRTGAYGLVLTDLHMPGLDGFQLTAAVREFEAQRKRSRTPVIALTANVLRTDVERCFEAGMDDYLSKPVTVRQLTGKLLHWLPNLTWDEPQPQHDPLPPGAAIEQAVLLEATGGDAGRERELLQLYCRNALEDLESLEAARQGADSGAVGALAHRIKGAALMVGANEVGEIAAGIERAVRRSRVPDLAPLLEKLRRAVARVEQYMQAWRA